MKNLLYFTLLFSLSTSVLAETIVVDQGGRGDFFSIQEAIDAAQEGDVVHVNPGSYQEGLTIDKNITLEGSGFNNTSITYAFGNAITITSTNGATIKNFKIISTHRGIFIFNEEEDITGDVLIDNCYVTECENDGIAYFGDGHLEIIRCNISNNTGEFNRNRGFGILFSSSTGETTLKMSNCIVSNNKEDGLWLIYSDDETGGGTPKSFEIRNCVFYSNGDRGVEFTHFLLGNGSVFNSIFADNTSAGISQTSNQSGDKIVQVSFSITYDDSVGSMVFFNSSDGNLSDVDPLLNEDFTLKEESPAIDAGQPIALFNDQDGTRNDMGAYGGPLGGPNGDAGEPILPPTPTPMPTNTPVPTNTPTPTITPTPTTIPIAPTATPTPVEEDDSNVVIAMYANTFSKSDASGNQVSIITPGTPGEFDLGQVFFRPISLNSERERELSDGFGMSVTVDPGQGALIFGQPQTVEDDLVLIRASVRTDGEDVSLSLGALDAIPSSNLAEASLNGTIGVNSLFETSRLVGEFQRMQVAVQAERGALVPVIQVASQEGAERISVEIDNLQMFRLTSKHLPQFEIQANDTLTNSSGMLRLGDRVKEK